MISHDSPGVPATSKFGLWGELWQALGHDCFQCLPLSREAVEEKYIAPRWGRRKPTEARACEHWRGGDIYEEKSTDLTLHFLTHTPVGRHAILHFIGRSPDPDPSGCVRLASSLVSRTRPSSITANSYVEWCWVDVRRHGTSDFCQKS